MAQAEKLSRLEETPDKESAAFLTYLKVTRRAIICLRRLLQIRIAVARKLARDNAILQYDADRGVAVFSDLVAVIDQFDAVMLRQPFNNSDRLGEFYDATSELRTRADLAWRHICAALDYDDRDDGDDRDVEE